MFACSVIAWRRRALKRKRRGADDFDSDDSDFEDLRDVAGKRCRSIDLHAQCCNRVLVFAAGKQDGWLANDDQCQHICHLSCCELLCWTPRPGLDAAMRDAGRSAAVQRALSVKSGGGRSAGGRMGAAASQGGRSTGGRSAAPASVRGRKGPSLHSGDRCGGGEWERGKGGRG
jgi:hypothetical protein